MRAMRSAATGNRGELELRHALQFAFVVSICFGVQPWDLHEDALAALRRDDRFAHAVSVHAFSNYLDRLVREGRT